eukprot:2614590-Prymnesium_polylepis.1
MVLDRLSARTALKRRKMRRTLLSFSNDGKSLSDHVSSESNGILDTASMRNQPLRYRFAIFLRSISIVPPSLRNPMKKLNATPSRKKISISVSSTVHASDSNPVRRTFASTQLSRLLSQSKVHSCHSMLAFAQCGACGVRADRAQSSNASLSGVIMHVQLRTM